MSSKRRLHPEKKKINIRLTLESLIEISQKHLDLRICHIFGAEKFA